MKARKGCKLRERKSPFIELLHTTPPRTVCPNFYVLAHANGCDFRPQCSYCYLKSSLWYLKEQQVFSNVDDMKDEIREWIASDKLETFMLNAGNLSDSLSFEPVRPLMVQLVEIFRTHAVGRPHTLLLVTKGGMKECESLLAIPSCPNVVISFSVNHPEASARHEAGAAPSEDRFRAAEALKAAGWRVRMRLDPMMLGFDYSPTVDRLRDLVPERITLGSLRAEPNLPRYVNNGLFAELEPSEHPKGLARYPLEKRLTLYRKAVDRLRTVCPLALCEEEPAVWEALGLDTEAKPCNCCI